MGILSTIPFTRDHLESLLTFLLRKENQFTHLEFANWCHSFWSNWRSDNDDLFNRTDEDTINVVVDIYEVYQNTGAEKFKDSQFKVWMLELNPIITFK
ncbi:hypothetical protein [Paenibacillus sp. PDC88]|uniref:Uncharacterized protein n=1 Tax=Paenibacillus provencensis TaxID=441151 RepID=A0ABW3PVQ0_9BACL|nr:hypothetical protein [Paenibacillus sp. PDC88]SDX88859.1 hypothetical protein SAMN05518848_12332 [Paenibacillus sp. PDC88]